MARESRTYQVVFPTGTSPSNLATADISFPPRVVERIDWRVPKGNMGLMGWWLGSGGVQLLPQQQGVFVIAHGESGYWEVEGLHTSGSWQARGYNTGTFPHSVFLTFHLGLIERPEVIRAPISPLLLTASPDLSKAGPPIRGR